MGLLSQLQTQSQQSVGRKIETETITILGIRPLAEDKCPKDKDGNPIPKSQVITKEVGNLFVFTSAIVNKPASFAHGAIAQVSIEERSYVDKNGKDAKIINVNRIEFTSNDEFMRTASVYKVTVSQ